VRTETLDAEEAGTRGMAFEQLDQLALDYLYGIRS
jgi:xylose isomerase